MIMNEIRHTILLFEPDAVRAGRIRLVLAGPVTSCLRVEWVTTLPDALRCLRRDEIEVVLLDTELCEGEGIDTLRRIRQVKPGVLVLLMSEPGDEPMPDRAGFGDAARGYPGPSNDTAPGLSGSTSLLDTLRRGVEAERLQRLSADVALTS
ncbi:MAG: response regulator [Methyloversatilis sp.]|uniref:response regulator n=1 Tax=Methyloversatilis sp. TaxID=2569862 RepID=UPI002734D71E|nr:response regulator [Methyloversatilis sp.]MDP2868429.1 response regulator [Methyloversatilis sp.]